MNSNFTGVIMVNLCPSGDFIEIQTFSVEYGRSHRFLLLRCKLESVFNGGENYALDTDLASFIRLSRTEGGIRFHVTWVSRSWNSAAISGHEDMFTLPDANIADLLAGKKIQRAIRIDEPQGKATIRFTEGAMHKVGRMSKSIRRALSKALRDNFFYGSDATVHIYGDFGHDLCFESNGICGGLVLHSGVLTGRDGREYKKSRYEIHT